MQKIKTTLYFTQSSPYFIGKFWFLFNANPISYITISIVFYMKQLLFVI